MSKEVFKSKQKLLDEGNYEIYNRELIRKVFPRIISDIKSVRPRAQVGDIMPFYFTILSYIDGVETLADGITSNKSYGASFPSQNEIRRVTGIDVRRQKWLAEVLRQNGLLDRYEERYIDMRRYTFYYPSFCPYITDDGYVIDADTGEVITPNIDDLIERLDYVSRWNKRRKST